MARLNAVLVKVLNDRALVDRFAALGAELCRSTSEELGKSIREDLERWRKVVRKAAIKVE